jgi:hypothetical protein
MKVNVEIDCTPEEARAFFGLPDLKPMQDRILAEIEQRMRTSLNAMDPTEVFKSWLPASMQGVEQVQQMQQMFWQNLAALAGGQKK